jgi:hypothetical protein
MVFSYVYILIASEKNILLCNQMKYLIISLFILPKLIFCYELQDSFFQSGSTTELEIDSFAPFGIELNKRAPESIIPLLKKSSINHKLYKSIFTSKEYSLYEGEHIPKKNKYFNRIMIFTSLSPDFLVNSIHSSYKLTYDKENSKYYDRTLRKLKNDSVTEYSIKNSFVSIDSFISESCTVIEKLCQKYGIPFDYDNEGKKFNFVDNLTYDSIFQKVSSFKNENLTKCLELEWTIYINDDEGKIGLLSSIKYDYVTLRFKLSKKPYSFYERELYYFYYQADGEGENIDDL